jgi:hypothetical protein
MLAHSQKKKENKKDGSKEIGNWSIEMLSPEL